MIKNKKVKIGCDGIVNELPKYSASQSIIEYICNGFDANAKEINIDYIVSESSLSTEDSLQTIESISISDNGDGINFNKLNSTFEKVFESEKTLTPSKFYFGRHGKGRFSFISFCNTINWKTSYKSKHKIQSYSIKISSDDLQAFHLSPSIEEPNGVTGTVVTLNNINSTTANVFILKNQITPEIQKYFAWYLEMLKDYNTKIIINGNVLNYDLLIKSSETRLYEYDTGKQKIQFKLKFIVWKNSFKKSSSRIYFLNNSGIYNSHITSQLNNNGDKFYHTVYVYSDYFDQQFKLKDKDLLEAESQNKDINKWISLSVKNQLISIRRNFIIEYAGNLIDDFEENGIFPEYQKNNAIQLYKHNLLVDTIRELYFASPKFFNPLKQNHKKIFVKLLNRVIESDDGDLENLFTILDCVIQLPDDQTDNLANILKTMQLSNIINSINTLEHRYSEIKKFERIVKVSRDNNYYEADVQHMMEANYWLIDEGFQLAAAENDKFKTAMKHFINKLSIDDSVLTEVEENYQSEGMNREMDILLGREDIINGRYRGTVLELKRPRINIGKTEARQLEDYMDELMKLPQFNDINYQWTFYIIGNKYDDEYFSKEFENSAKGEPNSGLFHSSKNCKMYVKTWSQIFNDYRLKYDFMHSKLKKQAETLVKRQEHAA